MQMRAIHKKKRKHGGGPGRRPRGRCSGSLPLSPHPPRPAPRSAQLPAPLPRGALPAPLPGERTARFWGAPGEGAEGCAGREGRKEEGSGVGNPPLPPEESRPAPPRVRRAAAPPPPRSADRLPTDTAGAALPPHRHGRGRHPHHS